MKTKKQVGKSTKREQEKKFRGGGGNHDGAKFFSSV